MCFVFLHCILREHLLFYGLLRELVKLSLGSGSCGNDEISDTCRDCSNVHKGDEGKKMTELGGSLTSIRLVVHVSICEPLSIN